MRDLAQALENDRPALAAHITALVNSFRIPAVADQIESRRDQPG